MTISVVRAIKIIDDHLSTTKRHNVDLTNNSSSKLPIVKNVRIKDAMCARNSREFEPRLTLPAFCVEWRGGPSPISSNQGSSKCSAAEILSFRRDRSDLKNVDDDPNVCVPDQSHVTSPQPPHKDLVKGSVNPFGPPKSNALIDKNRLCRNCIQRHVHGALGLRESPYGEPGFVYTALPRHCMKENRRLLGYTDYLPIDNLHGGVLLPEQPRQGVIAVHFSRIPSDHLLGGVNLPYDRS
ncbi:unnamed protein product [Phytomonas sp. Hart1]|nr:unnamed protein product [Phytomonas sp. Hart1]|eukprot:CCW68979.1 unnamed protein product [Phytomonas sp. isolate Hart1]